MENTTPPKNDLIISYLTLRKMIGLLGIALPVLLYAYSLLKGQTMQISISNYYFTQMRNVFVVTVSLVSVFLICYKGHDKDQYYSIAAGIFGLTLTFVHTNFKDPTVPCSISSGFNLREIVHLGSAGLFLLILAFISLKLFTKGNVSEGRKGTRNRVYKICGWVMIIAIAIMITYFAFPSLKAKFCEYKPVFWLEAISLWAFGFSWLVKGETLWKD